MAIQLNNSIQDVIVTISNPLLTTPVIITGFSPDIIIEVDNVINVTNRIGADGTISTNFMPALSTGRLHLQALAIGAATLRELQIKTSKLKLIYPGTMNVTSPSGQWTVTYNNFTIINAFVGFSTANNMVSDQVFEWQASLPDSSIVGDLLALAAAGIALSA